MTRIRNARREPMPIEKSETLTAMTAAEPTFAALYKEAHGQVAEVRALLGDLTVTLDRLARAGR